MRKLRIGKAPLMTQRDADDALRISDAVHSSSHRDHHEKHDTLRPTNFGHPMDRHRGHEDFSSKSK